MTDAPAPAPPPPMQVPAPPRLLALGAAAAVGTLLLVAGSLSAGGARAQTAWGAAGWAAGAAWLVALAVGGWPLLTATPPGAAAARGRAVLGGAIAFSLAGAVAPQLSPHGAHLALPLAALVLALPLAVALARLPSRLAAPLDHAAAPWVAGALAAGWYFAVSYTRHAHFGSGSKDMGLFLQSVWLLSRFHSPENTVMGMNAFADHAELVDLLFVPALWVWPSAGALLLGQAAAAGLGAVPVWRMARNRLGSPLAALMCALAYFLGHEIASGIMFDWNPTTVALGLFPWAVEAALAGRWRRMGVFLVLIGLCKENLLLYVGGFGLWLAALGAPRRVWLAVAAGAAGAFVLELKVFFPLFRSGGFRHFYFTDLGADFGDVLVNVMSSPARALALLFNPPAKVQGLLLPFSATALLGLLAPAALLPALPGVLERYWSTFQNSWWGHHYGGPAQALAVCAGILGGARLRAHLERFWPEGAAAWAHLPAAALLLAAISTSFLGPWGPSDLFVLHKRYHPSAEDRATMQAAVDSVPDGVPVAAQNYLLPHLAAREKIYLLERAAEADYVVMTPTTNPWPYDRNYHDRLAQQLLAAGWRVHFCAGNSFVLARFAGASVSCPVLGR